MKLTTLLLLAFCLHVGAAGYGQKVSISGKDLPLEKVFGMIKKQTGYVCFYGYEILQGTRNVDLSFQEANIDEVMKACLWSQGLDFSIVGKTITITRKAPKPEEAPVPSTEKSVKAHGVVFNEGGQSLSGANVTIKATGKGTITNAKGEFELPVVQVNSTLVISYIGYTKREVTVKDDKNLQIYLSVAKNELDKVVVQAYGTTTQRLATGNIATVSAAEIEKQPIANPLQALQGRVAGLNVTQTSGYASGPIKLELRGKNAINDLFPSDPLYIVDGVPLSVLELSGLSTYQTGSTGFLQSGFGLTGPAKGQSPLFSLNPADIQSIEVLKDADATSIYGSRAANGVVLITTKKGRVGKTKFDVRIEEGFSKVTRFWKMLNTSQYLAMRREALKNDGLTPDESNATELLVFDTTRYTDFQQETYGRAARYTDAQTTLSGGDPRTTFRLNAGYHEEISPTRVSGGDRRGSLSFNLMHRSLNQKFNVSLTTSYSYAKSNLINLNQSITSAPNTPPVYDASGNLNWDAWGPARDQFNFGFLKQPYSASTNFLNTSLVVGFQPVRGLNFSANLGYNNGQANQAYFQPISSQDPLSTPLATSYWGNNSNFNWIIEPQLTYDVLIGKGKLNILAGASTQKTGTRGMFMSGQGYTNDALMRTVSNAPIRDANDNFGEYKYAAVFGRLTYNWDDKYIVNVNARRDGSSKFGPGNLFGNFGSIGAAWIFSEEKWLKDRIPVLSFGKLRASYGTTGSDPIGQYKYLTRWSSSGLQNYNGVVPLEPTQHANPYFHWQVNKKLEAALNLGFLNDRLIVEATYYRNRCGNQLVEFPTPTLSGFSSVTANSPALVQNMGWEFTFNGKIIVGKDFTWTATFNSGFNRNKLLAYPHLELSPYANTLVIGKPLGIKRLLHYTGVDPQTGQYTFEDKNHDGMTSTNPGIQDDRYILNITPAWLGGIGNTFTYKGLQLSLFFVIKRQLGTNAFAQGTFGGTPFTNQPVSVLSRWQKPGDITTVARFTTQPAESDQYFRSDSDAGYTDASYFRLQNLSLAYDFPESLTRKAGMQGCSLFLHAENLFVVTKYKGIDPETQDFGGLPPMKALTTGITFKF